jgi:16S rRNA processing protein RimM
MVILGRVAGIFGVRGWIKLISDTDPQEAILDYAPWYLEWQGDWRIHRLLAGRLHGKGLIVHIDGCNDRDQAVHLVGCAIAVPRTQLPPLGPDEFYWSDLEGLRVQTPGGVPLGQVSHLFPTGANDVLVVMGERERLIPYIWGSVVQHIDLAAGLLVVDWDPEF